MFPSPRSPLFLKGRLTMKIHLPFRAAVCLLLTFTVSVSVISLWAFRKSTNGVSVEMAEKITEISEYIKSDYYFSVDSESVTDGAVSGYMQGLGDKYATYYDVEKSSTQADAINGDTHGIGIMAVESFSRDIYVYKVYRDSPAQLAGIKEGDRIISVEGEKVSTIGFSKAVDKLRGDKGKKTNLTLLRNSKEFSVSVKYDVTDIQSVYSYVTSGNIGVVQIIDFNKKTYPQFKAEVEFLKEQKVKGMIFDLRHNSGGTVETAAQMLDLLLPKCDTVHVKFKDGKVKVRNKSDKNSIDLPFAILTDRITASSSEIFASVMRQQNKAVLIGETTYGKALIQRTYPLKDGSKIKFTVGEFVPKNGESYNGKGLEPDIAVNPGFKISHEFYFLKPNEDKVLKAAVDYINQLS